MGRYMEDAVIEDHGTYGMLGFYRRSSTPAVNLFGSSIKCRETIVLRISRAQLIRDLSYDRYHGKEELIEVEMSPVQFANAITTFGHGDGHPCTINHVAGQTMGNCPEYTQRQKFEQELDRDVKKATKQAETIRTSVREKLLAKGSISVADRKELAGEIERMLMLLQSSIPFVQKQFNEAMDKTVSECKGEVEAFITSKVHRLGLEALAEMMPQLPSVEEPKKIEKPKND